jgi:activator of 2-hydroxyglutaryl-CoA dehydratase
VTRAAILLASLATESKVALTGEVVLDTAFVQRLWSRLLVLQSNVSLLLSPDAIFTGAYGAAILAARRFTRISQSLDAAFTDPSLAKPRLRSDRSLN